MAATRTTQKKRSAPWKREAPAQSTHTKLSPAAKRSAKAAARKGGRVYPSLVDNMRAATRQKARKK